MPTFQLRHSTAEQSATAKMSLLGVDRSRPHSDCFCRNGQDRQVPLPTYRWVVSSSSVLPQHTPINSSLWFSADTQMRLQRGCSSGLEDTDRLVTFPIREETGPHLKRHFNLFVSETVSL